MKAQDWSAVIVISLVGLVCLYFALEAVIDDQVVCFGRGCARYISLARQPSLFYLNLAGLVFFASVCIGSSIRIFFKSKHKTLR